MRSLGCQPGLLKCKGGFLMAERQNKVKKYRKPLNLNIGMLIFGAIFIYDHLCDHVFSDRSHCPL